MIKPKKFFSRHRNYALSAVLPIKVYLFFTSARRRRKKANKKLLPALRIHESLYLHNIIVRAEHDNSNLIFTAHKQNGAVYDETYECS